MLGDSTPLFLSVLTFSIMYSMTLNGAMVPQKGVRGSPQARGFSILNTARWRNIQLNKLSMNSTSDHEQLLF